MQREQQPMQTNVAHRKQNLNEVFADVLREEN